MPDTPRFPTAETELGPIVGTELFHLILARYMDPMRVAWPTAPNPDPTRTVLVELNWGKWVVRCPDCPSAQKAPFSDRRFYCTDAECPRPHGRLWYIVEWPTDWPEIEALIAVRGSRDHRYWIPGETLAQLQADNDAHPEALITPEEAR